MTAPELGLVLGAVAAVLVLAAYEWTRIVVSAYHLGMRHLWPQGARPHTSPIAGAGGTCHPKGAKRPPQGVDQSRNGRYGYLEHACLHGCDGLCVWCGCTEDDEDLADVQFPRNDFKLESALAAVPLGTALQPDFDAFFGGLEAAVAAGGVLLIAVVVVMTVRRFTSF